MMNRLNDSSDMLASDNLSYRWLIENGLFKEIRPIHRFL